MDTTTNPYAELAQKYTDSITQQNELLEQQSAIQEEQSKANTEQAISEIEQQKEYTQQDFTKEAKGAYSDYMKTVNPYGVQAENTYANGLGNSGYSETSKLNAYNTYQNRYATARESTDRLMEDFNNQINEARLSGNAELAEIALNKLQTQMDNLWNQLSMETSLTNSQVSYNQWLEEFEYQKQQDEIANQLAREELELEKASLSSSSSTSSGGSSTVLDTSGGGSTVDYRAYTDELLSNLTDNIKVSWADGDKTTTFNGLYSQVKDEELKDKIIDAYLAQMQLE